MRRIICASGLSALIYFSVMANDVEAPFVEMARVFGVRFHHQNQATSEKYMMEILAPGVALLDFNGDGWLDIYFVNGAQLEDPMGPGQVPDKTEPRFWNRLFRNRGNGSFEDVTEKAGVRGSGYGMGAAVGDYDNDGDPDLYVTNYGNNILYQNNGDGTFEEVTDASGTGDTHWSSSAAFFDYDNDGWLDLYVVNYLDYSFEKNIYCGEKRAGFRSYCGPTNFQGAPDSLFRNNHDGTFTDVSHSSGVANPDGKGLGVVTGDYNLDGYQDIYVANDSVMNFLYRGGSNQKFEEVGLLAGVAYSGQGAAESGMGVDMGDYDEDGLPDLVVTNLSFEGTRLYRNQGRELFSDVSLKARLQDSLLLVGFGVAFLDFDNDQDLDLFTVNGHIVDNVHLYQDILSFKQPKQLYENLGNHFSYLGKTAGVDLNRPGVGRGLAVGDLNNDGALDVVVGNCGAAAEVLVNRAGVKKNWLMLNLRGTRSNRDGVGARVALHAGGKVLHGQKNGGGSYLSAHDGRMHFGLGSADRIKRLEVLWPSGRRQIMENMSVNRVLTITEPEPRITRIITD